MKYSTEHRAIGCDRRVGKMKGEVKIKKKASDFRNERTRNRMATHATPSAISNPLHLIIHMHERASAEGKLTRHSRREAEVSSGSLAIRKPVKRSSGRFQW